MDQNDLPDDPEITTGQARNLYISHLLSTWNARTYEFASIIFTASAYPDTLTAASIRGIVTTVAMLVFSPLVGAWIDRTPSRLKTLIGTITVNRSAVVIACFCWLPIIGVGNSANNLTDNSSHSAHLAGSKTLHPFALLGNIPTLSGSVKHLVFVAVMLIGISEELSGSANMISMERDWVPTIAQRTGHTRSDVTGYTLTHLNAVMRRLDLICKLLSPILISLIISFTDSVRVGVVVVGGMSLASWSLEWWCALRVWRGSSQLQRPKTVPMRPESIDAVDQSAPSLGNHLTTWLNGYLRNMKQYFAADVWMPSMALAMLHLTVLSYSAPFITHLLNAGFSLPLISGARAASSVFEVSSTLVMPWGVWFLSKPRRSTTLSTEVGQHVSEESSLLAQDQSGERPGRHRSGDSGGLERLGLWGLWGQLICLVPVVLALWNMPSQGTGLPNFLISKLFLRSSAFRLSPPNRALETFALFFFLSLSRLGMWTYDLTAQQLSQVRVPPHQRSSFAGTEYSFVALFNLLNYIAAAMFSATEQFRWLALGSLGAVGMSTAVYSLWLRRERGHLVHFEKIGLGIPFRRAV